jgi:hypothetical protein
MDDFIPKSFDELIGSKHVLKEWKETFRTIKSGDIVFVSGYSCTGKTLGTRLLVKEFAYNGLFLDTNNANDSKDIYDRIEKFHNWSEIGTVNPAKKVVLIDEIDSFIKFDRGLLNTIMTYTNRYKKNHIPIVLISHNDVLKKLGSIKNCITHHIKLNRLEDIDIFLYFKSRIPKNKIKIKDLMQIVEGANGNIYSIIMTILNKKQKYINYVGDEQKSFNEIFECKNPLVIEKLLSDDEWMHPLKIHENIIKIVDIETYYWFLEKYLYYELWYSNRDEFFYNEIPIVYISHVLLHCKKKDIKVDTMDFSKLLSYISTKKKYRKLLYDKVPVSYPIEDLGLHWIHTEIYKKNIL